MSPLVINVLQFIEHPVLIPLHLHLLLRHLALEIPYILHYLVFLEPESLSFRSESLELPPFVPLHGRDLVLLDLLEGSLYLILLNASPHLSVPLHLELLHQVLELPVLLQASQSQLVLLSLELIHLLYQVPLLRSQRLLRQLIESLILTVEVIPQIIQVHLFESLLGLCTHCCRVTFQKVPYLNIFKKRYQLHLGNSN